MVTPTTTEDQISHTEVVGPFVHSSARPSLSDTEVPIVQLGQGALFWRRFRRHKLAMIGAVIMCLLSLLAFFAPLISPEDYLSFNYFVRNAPPRLTYPGAYDWVYLLGSDVQGHSLLMWIVYGARVSLTVGILSALLTSGIGVVVGAIAGHFGGWTDAMVMRITDIFLTIPTLPLLIMLSYYMAGGSMWMVILIFGLTTWPAVARLLRAYYLSFREREFIQAAHAMGVSDMRIMFRHVLPNTLSPVIVTTTLYVAIFISSEAAIDYLGVGIRPPSVSWGLALADSQAYFGANNWWAALFPGLFILITVLAINFLGDGLRDALDVRSRNE